MKAVKKILLLLMTAGCTVAVSAQAPEIKMVFVRGGLFSMGCTAEQGLDCSADERPVHNVTIGDFYIGKYEVTQAEWVAVMDSNPSYFTLAPSNWDRMKSFIDGVNELNRTHYAMPSRAEWMRASVIDDLPVEQVNWDDVQEFIRRLNAMTGMDYRLPTEAEWEYAARGGQSSRGYKYSGSNDVDEVAWYGNNSGAKTHLVGTKKPNELGIHDMSGNVSEWTADWFSNYSATPQTNPRNNVAGTDLVFRGGGWHCGAQLVRTPIRLRIPPRMREPNLGFRLARSAKN